MEIKEHMFFIKDRHEALASYRLLAAFNDRRGKYRGGAYAAKERGNMVERRAKGKAHL
ncbi:MAG TPA: hypothetical protein IAC39_07655 [Candidatus Faeciplasma pullistercoris]|uniref:Uncharacterized protein n=1 Tax=Candidatus Faeciplasma pullistercoris TaxID=2840800 RepID=A0A9D1GV27_9FIRM|nr:hypothetical protein [Candidatus Faeciplasma pullistercoris]